jgi:hypothetical protein
MAAPLIQEEAAAIGRAVAAAGMADEPAAGKEGMAADPDPGTARTAADSEVGRSGTAAAAARDTRLAWPPPPWISYWRCAAATFAASVRGKQATMITPMIPRRNPRGNP